MHETGHWWCCNVGDPYTGSGIGQLEIVSGDSHWTMGLHSPHESGSADYAKHWIPNGDGTYKRAWSENLVKYHPFTLYFMGLSSPDEHSIKYPIYDTGNIDSSNLDYSNANTISTPLYGEVSIDDIIAVEGQRSCAY